ncbi:DUF2380 domain-containing protein [Archangium violaceum]|uniref:DUF2380 domain-containing protein n=1 Tax=Archangium violaceum TaxID=83451 RepID=UPI0036D99E7A
MSSRCLGTGASGARLLLALALAILLGGCATAPPRASLTSGYSLHSRSAAFRDSAGPHWPAVPVADSAEREVRQSAIAAQLAFRGAVLDVSGSTRRISSELARLKVSGWGLARANDVFLRYADYGTEQLRWIDAQLAAATRLANAAAEVEDPGMQLALLRVAGPRLEAAMVGSLLLAVWLDFLNLADVALRQHLYSVETLFADMWRWQEMLEPAMRALSSREHEQMEAAAQDLPLLVGHLTSEFSATVERMRVGAENLQKVLVLKEAIETVTMLSTMRFSLPSVPPSAPALVGIGLAVGGDGVMMGARIVVSAEWVEMVRQLVRAGVLSLPVVSAAVRIQAGQVMLAQARRAAAGRARGAGRWARGGGHARDGQSGGWYGRVTAAPRHAERVPRVVRETRLHRRDGH